MRDISGAVLQGKISFAIAASIILVVMMSVGGLQATPFLACSFLLFALPGVLVLLRVSRQAHWSYCWEEILLVGSILGVCVSSVFVSLTEYFCEAKILYQLGALVIMNLSTIAIYKNTAPVRAPLQQLDRTSRYLLVIFLLIIAIALALPYASFGQVTAKGIAFNELHKTDLLHHMVTLIELEKGIPPQNPYFSGESLHYFWLAHILPSFAWGLSSLAIQPRDLIVLTGLLYSLLFVGVLLITLRRFYSDTPIILLLMTVALAAYGYNYIFVAARWIIQMLPHDTFLRETVWQKLFVDDWGQQYTGYSHGWFRSFLVEPHTTLALSAILSAVVVSKHNGFFPDSLAEASIQGVLLTCSLAMDSFLGLLVILSFGLFGLFQFLHLQKRLQVLKSLFVIAVMVVLMILFMYLSGMVSLGHKSLALVPYTKMIILSPVVFFLDYGPMFVLGVIGLFLVKGRGKTDEETFFIILFIVSLFFMFFIRYPDVGTQVFRKSGTVLRIALVVFSGVALQRLQSSQKMYTYILFASIVLAVPTLIADIWRISTFDKEEERTYYVNQQDYDAYLWMRQNTSPTALIQDLPGGISNIPAFAQRRTALGDWVHAENYQIGTEKVLSRHKDIFRTLFQGEAISDAIQVMEKYNIQYLYVGTEAVKMLSSHAKEKFELISNRLKKVYAQDGIAVYHFESEDKIRDNQQR